MTLFTIGWTSHFCFLYYIVLLGRAFLILSVYQILLLNRIIQKVEQPFIFLFESSKDYYLKKK